MSMEIVQHAVVTLVALAASAALCRRVFGSMRPSTRQTGCAGCPSAQGVCAATTQTTSGSTVQAQAVLIRTAGHVRSRASRMAKRADSVEP